MSDKENTDESHGMEHWQLAMGNWQAASWSNLSGMPRLEMFWRIQHNLKQYPLLDLYCGAIGWGHSH